MKQRAGVDIVIPVYNALEDLKLCVESIKKHTDLTLDRAVFIDDRSPDPEVYPYLKSIEGPGMLVLQNEKNRGFSGTVNHGMTVSDRDVILLNTDTVVTSGWIDKLVECAYSDPAIGTVTPFSNNATLCSVPNFCQENTIPYGLSIDEYAAEIERCSLKKYPRITVAVGFCMYIKREVIANTGLFDEATFQRGYGEENDFCWRAEQLGYYHVLCDNTYIYHSGSASFVSAEKMQLMKDHEQILLNWYPAQMHANDVYVRDNPDQYLRANVDLYAKLRNGRKNILEVLHLDFRTDASNNIGGTQFHVKDLVSGLRKDHNLFVLARAGEFLRLTVYLEEETLTLKFYVGKNPDFPLFYNKEIAKVYRNILQAFSIDAVHIHHIMGLSFDLFPITKEAGIPLVMTMHDNYFVCPSITLLENGTHYCQGAGQNCAECMNKQLGYAAQVAYLPLWQKRCREAMGMCDQLIAPSQAAKEVYAKVYPETADRIRVIPHGLDPTQQTVKEFLPGQTPGFSCYLDNALTNSHEISGWAIQENVDSKSCELLVRVEDSRGTSETYWALPVYRGDLAGAMNNDKYAYGGFTVQIPDAHFAAGKLKFQLIIRQEDSLFHSDVMEVNDYQPREKTRKRIAFLGGLNTAKGSDVAYQLMEHYGSKYDWYIIGGIGDGNLATLEKSNVFKLGWYKRENIRRILQQYRIDAVCILSICAETFCYTLSEAQLAGVPAVVTDIGALGERMRRDQTGWLVNADISAKELQQKLDAIFADEAQYAETLKQAADFHHRTVAQMCEDYRGVYSGLDGSKIQRTAFDANAIYMAYAQGTSDLMISMSPEDSVLMMRRLNELETQMAALEQSLEYRMVRFFNRENFPFKKPIKWMIGFIYRIYKKFFKK